MKIAFFILILTVTVTCKHKAAQPLQKTEKPLSIAILPYNNFDSSLLSLVKRETEAFFHCNVRVLAPKALPANAWYEPRQRYKADSLLAYQKILIPPATNAIAGLTNKDISTFNGKINDWGVFGLGYCPGNACIISVYRLQIGTAQQFKERLIKVVLHELGHNLGLPHCNFDSTCLMNDAKGTIAQVDKERKWLCGHCKSLLEK